jgi:hypothetical protein
MRGSTPPFPQYVFIIWFLIKQWMHLHGVVLNLAQTNLHLPYKGICNLNGLKSIAT